MNRPNQLLLSILFVILIVAIPYLVYLITLQHDAKMCDYIRECQISYKTTTGFDACAKPFMQSMILKFKK